MSIKIDQLIRSRRKTIGLQINKDAQLIVRAPLFTSENYIQKVIQTKETWIRQKQEFLRLRQSVVRKFIPGEEFMVLGQNYTLMALDDLPKAVLWDDSLRISSVVLSNAKDHLECWYKAKALEHINARVEYYADLSGLKHQSVKVNNANTRWGSCGYNDTLNFNWKLIMAPQNVIDSVVAHELAHIQQKNHSRKFWAEVKRIMPDYLQGEKWLKQNGHLLAW